MSEMIEIDARSADSNNRINETAIFITSYHETIKTQQVQYVIYGS